MLDYDNDLAFKPAMSWEDLCEYAKSKWFDVVNSKEGLCFIRCHGIAFIKNHRILASGTITDNVSYERMKTIIDALRGE